MARIGRRYKRKMQGTSNYVKKAISTSPATPPPSSKRLRLQFKRQGGPDAVITKFTPFEPSELQSLHVSLRHALYYFYVFVLDAPHKEHWGEGRHNLYSLQKTYTCATHPPKDPPHTISDFGLPHRRQSVRRYTW